MKKLFKAFVERTKAARRGITTAVVVAATVAATGMIGLHAIRANAASSYDCDANAVVWCGGKDASTLAGKYSKGDGHNSATSIHNIYSYFGISSSDISSMKTYAVNGTVTKGGNVYVGSTLVATNALTGGRHYISGSAKHTYGGTTFYTRQPSVSFLQGSLKAVVVMKNGVFQFALLNACGNPVTGKPKMPNYSISKQVRAAGSSSYSSSVTVKSGSKVQYQITVSSTGAVPVKNVTVHDTLPSHITYTAGTLKENGATVSSTNAGKFFGSGLLISSINPGSKVVFTFDAQAGAVSDTSSSCKAESLNNLGIMSSTGLPTLQSGAKVNTTCTPPPKVALNCLILTATPGAISADGSQAYTLTGKASVANATITSYVFSFGDGGTKAVAASATSASTPHTYAPGSYTASVTVTATANNKTYTATAPVCQAPIKVKELVKEAACVQLNPVMIDRNSFRLDAKASVTNATISSYDFVVKDVNGKTVATNNVKSTDTKANTTVNLTDAGTYTAIVTVNTSLGAKSGPDCQTKLTVKESPEAACKALAWATVDNNNFKLSAEATAVNGATIQGYDFVVKDSKGNTAANESVNTTDATAKTQVALSNPGDYTAQVTVRTSEGAKTGPQCTQKITVPPAPNPNITITKTVDMVKREQVNVGQNFVYQLIVTNTGSIDLKNAVVTDPAPQGVTMVSADLGTVANNAFSYTIPSLKVGESVTINITANVAEFVDGELVNTACVNAPEVNPEQPEKADACDTATVTVPPLPPELPNTGAGNVIGIFVGVVATATVGYRLFLSRKLARR